MSFDPDVIYVELTKSGDDWADKKAAYQTLDDLTKSILADITSRYIDAGQSKSAAETSALASKDYREHLASLSKARREWLFAQVKWENLKTLSELRRSQESTRRQEMRL